MNAVVIAVDVNSVVDVADVGVVCVGVVDVVVFVGDVVVVSCGVNVMAVVSVCLADPLLWLLSISPPFRGLACRHLGTCATRMASQT